VSDVSFGFDPTHGAEADVDEPGHLGLLVSRLAEYLDCVPLEHVDHPFPRCLMQRVCDLKESAQSGQNFRKKSGQNLRNPQLLINALRLKAVSVQPAGSLEPHVA
jgi:hypothetical protein